MNRRPAVFVVLLMIVTSACRSGRTTPTSRTTVDGVVVAEGLTMPGVRVTISAPGLPSASTLTDDEGRYAFTVLAPATYDIEAELPGFGALRRRIHVTEPVSLELQLPLRESS